MTEGPVRRGLSAARRGWQAFWFQPQPAYPLGLVRIAFGLVGLALLAVMVVFGVVVGAAMIAAGLLYKLWRSRATPVTRDAGRQVVDGEYRVLDRAALDDRRAARD